MCALIAAVGGIFLDLEAAVPQLLGFVHAFTPAELLAAQREQKRSANYLELLGIRYWWDQYGQHCVAKRVLLATDSRVSYEVLRKGYSQCGKMQFVVREVQCAAAKVFATPRVRSVVGAVFNKVADLLSRGDECGAETVARRLFGLRLDVSHV